MTGFTLCSDEAGTSQCREPTLAKRSIAHRLSYNQETFLLMLDGDRGDLRVQNAQGCAALEGPLDLGAVRAAVRTLADRHEVLRTRFALDEDPPLQIVEPSVETAVPHMVVDVPGGDPAKSWQKVVAHAARSQFCPFVLSQSPNWSVEVFSIESGRHVAILTLSHLLADAQTIDILLGEFDTEYRRELGHDVPFLSPVRQYHDHVEEQRGAAERFLHGGATTVEQWREVIDYRRLARFATQQLERLRPRLATSPIRHSCGEMDAEEWSLDAEPLAALRKLSLRHSVTLNVVCLAAWHRALQRSIEDRDIVVWSEKTIRPRRFRGTPGCFSDPTVYTLDPSGPTALAPTLTDLDCQLHTYLGSNGLLVALIQADPVVFETWLTMKAELDRHLYQFFGPAPAAVVEAVWRPITVGHPTDFQDGLADLHCCVLAGHRSLRVRLRWDIGVWDRMPMEQLLARFKAELLEIAAGNGPNNRSGRIAEVVG